MKYAKKDKKSDSAGPDIGNFGGVQNKFPNYYTPILTRKETMKALYMAKGHIEENLCNELNMMMVKVPPNVDVESGVIDMLDRAWSRTAIESNCGLGPKSGSGLPLPR